MAQVFSCEFSEMFQNSFFYRASPVAASGRPFYGGFITSTPCTGRKYHLYLPIFWAQFLIKPFFGELGSVIVAFIFLLRGYPQDDPWNRNISISIFCCLFLLGVFDFRLADKYIVVLSKFSIEIEMFNLFMFWNIKFVYQAKRGMVKLLFHNHISSKKKYFLCNIHNKIRG